MTLLTEWVRQCNVAAHHKADFFSGCRKIVRNYHMTFPTLDQSLQIEHAGYTKNKMSQLTKNYLHTESQKVATMLWDKRRDQAKYGSVTFTTFAHFVKGDVAGATPRGSVFGPCILAVSITLVNPKTYAVDVFYRTTELMKKFPADLVFIRDTLLAPFNFKGLAFDGMNCHFANVTSHPMYWVTLVPHMDDPIRELERLKQKDKFYWQWVVKWTARYMCKEFEHGIQKFAQSLRVQVDAQKRIDKQTSKTLQAYLRKNHPGFKSTRFNDDDD
jgi:hypothetical protein